MDKLNKAVIIMAKIAEVIHWIGAALMAVLAVMFAVGKGDSILNEVDAVSLGSDFTIYGFNIDEATGGNLTGGSMLVIFLTGLITCILMAMVFRNVYLIFRTAEGKTRFSKGATPFQPDIVRMVREIGIFCIAVPVVSFVMSIVLGIVSGNGVHATVELTSVFYGLIVLSLSRFFAYGQQLQEDTEGLV